MQTFFNKYHLHDVTMSQFKKYTLDNKIKDALDNTDRLILNYLNGNINFSICNHLSISRAYPCQYMLDILFMCRKYMYMPASFYTNVPLLIKAYINYAYFIKCNQNIINTYKYLIKHKTFTCSYFINNIMHIPEYKELQLYFIKVVNRPETIVNYFNLITIPLPIYLQRQILFNDITCMYKLVVINEPIQLLMIDMNIDNTQFIRYPSPYIMNYYNIRKGVKL